MALATQDRSDGLRSRVRGRTGWIGVDLGSSAIKIAQLERRAGQFCLTANTVIVPSGSQRFSVADLTSRELAQNIRSAISTHGGFDGRLTACVLSMSFVELRTLVHARGSEDEQRELISLELDSNSSKSKESCEFEFWDASAPERSDQKGMSQVNVLSVRRELTDGLGSNLLRAGLECRVLDGLPFTVLRSRDMMARMNHSGSGSQDIPIAAIDWGQSTAMFVILSGGQPVFSRTLRDCGLKQFYRTVQERLGLEAPETRELLLRFGLTPVSGASAGGSDLQRAVTEIAGDMLGQFNSELARTLSWLRLQLPDLFPRTICLSGSGSTVRNIEAHIHGGVRVPVRIWNLRQRSTEVKYPVSLFANAAALSALAWEQ